jgi:tyrosine-protein phosphatase YwqE
MGLFNLFQKSDKNILADLSAVGTDIHSHLIPGIDDGSKSIEESLKLVNELCELGYKKIITTPHIMTDYYRNTPEIILSGLEKLKKEIEALKIPIEIEAAAEYYLDHEFLKKIEEGNLLTMGDNFVLFELSYLTPPQSIETIIFNLQSNGYKTILAHPERYQYWNNNFETYEKLKDRDVYFQLNINSLSGEYSPLTQKVAEKLIQNNMIDFVGTDCHGMRHIERLHKALENKYLSLLIESGKLLNNKM